MPRLDSIEFYQELKKRQTENAIQYCGLLQPIVADAEKILAYIKNRFPTFPDHDLEHSFRILRYIYLILSDDEKSSFSETEIFCLIMAALFHDTGMALFENEDADELRENHHYKCDVVINKYFDEKLSLLSSADRIKKAVIFACNAHGRLIDDLYNDRAFDTIDIINFDPVRYSVLAVLMRIGDLLDMDNMRSHPFIMSLFKNSYTTVALNHNKRHQMVQRYSPTPEKIEIVVVATNVEQHKIWSSWFTYLNDDILRANTYLKGFHFPSLDYEINKSDGAKYDVQELRFEIDEKGGIWNIISQSIYTNKLDFVRELLQNAIDASLSKIYLQKDIVLPAKSPRSWESHKYVKNIVVGYSESTNRLYVADYGVGMSKEDLQKFLFKISSSGSNTTSDRDFEFPGIAKFGIGFISCLVNANSIKIYTCKYDSHIMHAVSLESTSTLAFMESVENDGFTGTSIVLDLKNNYTYREIEDYIASTFRYASVGIDCVNIDTITKISDILNIKNTVSELQSKPYLFGAYYEKISKMHNNTIVPLVKKTDTLMKLRNNITELIQWIEANKEHDDNYSDSKKYKIYKERIAEISHNINKLKICDPVPDIIKNITEKELFTNLNLITELEKYHLVLKNAYKTLNDKISGVSYIGTNVYNPKMFSFLDTKYMILLLDESMKTTDIICTDEAPDLSEKTGIVLLNQKHTDSQRGYEFSCVNGFLFGNGEICNAVAKFARNKSVYTLNTSKSDYIIGTQLEYDELWDYINEEYSDNYNYDYYNYDYEPEEVQNIFEPVYDVLHIKNNEFTYTQDVEKSQYLIDSVAGRGHSYPLENYMINLHAKDSIGADKSVAFENIVCHLDSQFYQDGIRIPFPLEDLIPFGFFRIICNCTADSRAKLNVTRHNASEIPDDIENWMESAGSNIQKLIMSGINDMLASLNLDADFKAMHYRDCNQYISKYQRALKV